MFNLILFGAPGSGKGTQSEKIIQKYGVAHLSTGDLLRKEIASNSQLGKKISQMIDDGNFVTDQMAKEVVENFIDQNNVKKGFVFDGVPRTVNQAEWLDGVLKTRESKIDIMISLEVDDEELKKRLLARGKELNRPDDQGVEIIQTRLNIYRTRTKPVKEFYRKANKLEEIDGSGTVDEVFKRICQAIEQCISKQKAITTLT